MWHYTLSVLRLSERLTFCWLMSCWAEMPLCLFCRKLCFWVVSFSWASSTNPFRNGKPLLHQGQGFKTGFQSIQLRLPPAADGSFWFFVAELLVFLFFELQCLCSIQISISVRNCWSYKYVCIFLHVKILRSFLCYGSFKAAITVFITASSAS